MSEAIDPEKFARRQVRAQSARPSILTRADYGWVILALENRPMNNADLMQETGFDHHHLDNVMTVLLGHDFVRPVAQQDHYILTESGKELAAEISARAQSGLVLSK